MHRLALLLAAVLTVPALAAPAEAACPKQDDDWEVGGKSKIDDCALDAYRKILAKNPFDGDALARLLRHKKAAKLETEYDAKLAKSPNDYATLIVLARLRKMQGDEPGALAYFEQAHAIKADDPRLLIELAALYRNAGKLTEARDAYDKALAKTTSADVKKKALRALADLALTANDIEAAKKYFDKYLALEPKNIQLKVELGDALLQAGRHDEAIATYRAAEDTLKSDPSRRMEVVLRIGQALEAKGSDDDATAEYRRALKLVPKGHYIEGEVTSRIIDIYRRKQDLASLLAQYEQQWPVKKRGHFEWATLGLLYDETGAQDKAIQAYRSAVKKAPWELDTQRRLIVVLESLGRADEAIKQYEAVVKVAPSEARFQLELADRYERRGDLKKALATLKRLEQSFPGDPGVQSALADLYQRWNKDDLALAAYERLAKLEPNDPAHLVVLGEQYWAKGDKANQDKAIAIWKRIANAKTAKAYAKLGDTLAEHGMQVDGLAHYAKAIKLEPKNPDLYKGRAAIYEGQKQWAEALADWESAMSLLGDKPTDRVARREGRRHIVQLLTRWGGKEAEYRTRWQVAFKASPPDVEAGFFLVEYYERRPTAGEPKQTLEKLRTLVPKDEEVIGDLVKAYRSAHDYDKAIKLLLELEQLAPHRKREIYTQIAEIKTDERKDDEAIEWAKAAVTISDSKDPVAWERLAERYLAMQHHDAEAIEAYERSLELDRFNFKAGFVLAQLYRNTQQDHKAALLYRRMLKDTSDEETVLKAGRQGILVEGQLGTLGDLERVLAPLSFTNSHKPVYRRILVELYDRHVHDLVRQLRHGDATTRKAARTELDRLGQHGLKPLLEALNDDRDLTGQRNAVFIIGHLGNPGAAPALVRIAKTEPKPDVAGDPRKLGTLKPSLDWESRVEALVAAGRLGSKDILGAVLPLAKHDEVAMREAAIFTIGRTRDKRAVAPLVTALDDRRESVQALACLGLSGIDDAKGTAAMIEVVGSGKRHDLVRAACAWSLGVRKAKGAVAVLSEALTDNHGDAQRLAGWALAQIGDRKAMASLVRAYFTRDDAARPVLAWSLAHLTGAAPATGSGEFTDYALRNGKLHLATAVSHLPGDLPQVTALTQVVPGNEKAIAEGIRAALGEHRDLVLSTLLDLDARDDGLSLGSLVTATATVDAQLAKSLAAIAASIGEDVAGHLADRDAKVRAVALSVAAKIDAPGVDEAIAKAFSDPAGLVRQAAMRAVVVVHGRRSEVPRALAAGLTRSLTADDWDDRRAAAQAIGRLGAAADVAALSAALADDNAFVREEAAIALGRLGARSATDALITATHDDTWNVRAAAAAALRAAGDPKAKPRLAELAADDPQAEVRAAAAGK
jgi:cellulose synthase operon protein C